MTASLPSPIKSREALLIARRAAKLSQSELAMLLGMQANSISHIETGLTALTPRVAAHIALVFAWLDLAGGKPAALPAPGRPAKASPIDPTALRHRRRMLTGGPLSFEDACKLAPGSRYEMSCCIGDTPWSAWMVYERTSLAPTTQNDKFIEESLNP